MDDLISRQAAIERATKDHDFYKGATTPADMARRDELLNVMCWLGELPPAQPERTCVNCGRTANNGGWYADGSTKCPIEEHYALPKDGFCHLWEKRNVTDDNYQERREG